MKYDENERFERVYKQSSFTAYQYIYVDRATGVQYLVIHSGQGCGVTPLIDAEGKPLLYKEKEHGEE